MIRGLVVFLAFVVMAMGVGCAALSLYVTPADIDQQALDYASKAGVADPNDYGGWWGNLYQAERLDREVDQAYEVNVLELQQLADRNELDYGILKNSVTANLTQARAREEALFGEKGLLSLGLSMAGFGGLTGFVGLMRKRPGDVTQADMEGAVTQYRGEVTDKDRQLIEVVRGVQAYLSIHKDDESGKELKVCLSKQSADTRRAVAVAKTAA